MSLRFAILGVLSALIAVPVVGCLGTPFSAGSGASGGGTTSGTTVTTTSTAACPGTETSCAGACTDTQTDNDNCGTCGTKCDPGATCTSGKCKCPGTRTDCGATEGCVDTTSDSQNCGMCSKSCNNTSCVNGACSTTCTGTMCSGVCVNTTNDNKNCGGCNKPCPSGASCMTSACVCGNGETLCTSTNTCVDTMTDSMNCGGCGKPCASGQVCNSGICGCPSGTMMCAGSTTCTDIKSDPDNCNGCGQTCEPGELCTNGSCTCSGMMCSVGQGMNVCTTAPMGNSPEACGAGCGMACGSTQACNGGNCACRPELTACPGTNGGMATCVNLLNDPSNCGACGTKCITNVELCALNGTTGHCVAATSACPALTTNCSGGCVDTNTDPLHCGGCGTACAVDQVCVGGTCQDYFPASACTGCPCPASCGSAHTCCTATIGTTSETYCVAGPKCPG